MADKSQAASNGEIVPANDLAFKQLLQKMSMMATMDTDEGAAAANQIANVSAILNAETEAEMWDADERGPMGGRDLADVEQEILYFAVKFSPETAAGEEEMKTIFVAEDGRKLYLLVSARRLDTDEQIVWNTSAPGLVAKLFWLDSRDKFPYQCVIRATNLPGGKKVLKLKAVPIRRAVMAS